MRKTIPIAAIALFVLAACGNDFKDYSFIRALSVLAIKSEPAELAPGQTGRLTVVFADPAGAGREVALDWSYCALPPAPTEGIAERCLTEAEGSHLVKIGAGETLPFTMPKVPTAPCGPIACPTTLGFPDPTDGFYLSIRLDARAGKDRIVAIFPLRYSLGLPAFLDPRLGANLNPKLGDLMAAVNDARVIAPLGDGEMLSAGDRVVLQPSLPRSPETYLRLDPATMKAVEVEEALRLSWFATAGKFTSEHTGFDRPATELAFEKTQAPGPVDLWVVARDDRGGVDFVHRTLMIR
ncbi:MAG: hypothetical protein EXR72_04840 [Myxococcales bacterium]|nr:hypothetical protein [Myxococcales bacterium]